MWKGVTMAATAWRGGGREPPGGCRLDPWHGLWGQGPTRATGPMPQPCDAGDQRARRWELTPQRPAEARRSSAALARLSESRTNLPTGS